MGCLFALQFPPLGALRPAHSPQTEHPLHRRRRHGFLHRVVLTTAGPARVSISWLDFRRILARV